MAGSEFLECKCPRCDAALRLGEETDISSNWVIRLWCWNCSWSVGIQSGPEATFKDELASQEDELKELKGDNEKLVKALQSVSRSALDLTSIVAVLAEVNPVGSA